MSVLANRRRRGFQAPGSAVNKTSTSTTNRQFSRCLSSDVKGFFVVGIKTNGPASFEWQVQLHLELIVANFCSLHETFAAPQGNRLQRIKFGGAKRTLSKTASTLENHWAFFYFDQNEEKLDDETAFVSCKLQHLSTHKKVVEVPQTQN